MKGHRRLCDTQTCVCETVSPADTVEMADDINFDKIPVRALRTATRNILATLLDDIKVIPSPNKLPRDWRGLEQLTGEKISRHDKHVEHILHAWEKSDTATLGELQSFLAQIDRYDVLDDTCEMMRADAEHYLRKIENGTPGPINSDADSIILTVDDVHRLDAGIKEPQNYDAFLLYTDEDIDIAKQIVDKLEKDYHLKLCFKDRDLVIGLPFEHEAMMRLISERCHRLVVVVSESFLDSPVNKFLVTFAQAVGIAERKRKVVPCLYTDRCRLPLELNYCFLLDYSRSIKMGYFWDKLHDSIRSPVMLPQLPASQASVTIKEIKDEIDCKTSKNSNELDGTIEDLKNTTIAPVKTKHKHNPSSPTSLFRSILPSSKKALKKKTCSDGVFKKKNKMLC